MALRTFPQNHIIKPECYPTQAGARHCLRPTHQVTTHCACTAWHHNTQAYPKDLTAQQMMTYQKLQNKTSTLALRVASSARMGTQPTSCHWHNFCRHTQSHAMHGMPYTSTQGASLAQPPLNTMQQCCTRQNSCQSSYTQACCAGALFW